MKKNVLCSLLVLTLLVGMVGTSFAASTVSPPVLPFGEELVPLSQEELDDVEGAWGAHAAAAVVGAAIGGLSYWTSTAPAERNWTDGLVACAVGAMSTLMGKFL